MCRYTTLWYVNVLRMRIANKTTYVTTHFKKLTQQKQRVCCLSYCQKKSHFTVFTSNVQCVRLAAGRRIQAGDATDQWRDRPNAAALCPIQWQWLSLAGWLTWININRLSVERHPKQRNRPDLNPGCLGARCQTRSTLVTQLVSGDWRRQLECIVWHFTR